MISDKNSFSVKEEQMTYLVKFLYEPLHIFSAIIHVLTKILHRKKYYFNMILDYATTFSGRLNEIFTI
jgi:hypothetical protein